MTNPRRAPGVNVHIQVEVYNTMTITEAQFRAQAHKQLDDNHALFVGAPEHMREAMLPLLATSSKVALTVLLGDDCYDALINRLN